MDLVEAIILGIVQGATEWLPISSSGHLVIFQHYMGTSPPLLFELLLHLGSLLAVLAFFRHEVWSLVKALGRLMASFIKGEDLGAIVSRDRDARMVSLMVIGSVPIAVAGYLLEPYIAKSFGSLLFVGIALMATGTILYPTGYLSGGRGIVCTSKRDALVVGLAQAVALFPGFSRSGLTIATGLYHGLDREMAARYSLLLAIPAIAGASLYHLVQVIYDPGAFETYMVLGMLVAAVIGYATINPLLAAVRRARFHNFAFYCWAVGALVFIWALDII